MPWTDAVHAARWWRKRVVGWPAREKFIDRLRQVGAGVSRYDTRELAMSDCIDLHRLRVSSTRHACTQLPARSTVARHKIVHPRATTRRPLHYRSRQMSIISEITNKSPPHLPPTPHIIPNTPSQPRQSEVKPALPRTNNAFPSTAQTQPTHSPKGRVTRRPPSRTAPDPNPHKPTRNTRYQIRQTALPPNHTTVPRERLRSPRPRLPTGKAKAPKEKTRKSSRTL